MMQQRKENPRLSGALSRTLRIAAPVAAGALILLCLASESVYLGAAGPPVRKTGYPDPVQVVAADPVKYPDSGQTNAGDQPELAPRTRLELEALREEHQRLTERNTALEHQLTALLQWMLDNLKGTVPLPESSASRLAFQGVTDTFELDPEVARFLHISAEETALINDAFSYSSAEVQRLIGENLVVTALSEDQVIVEVSPYPADGSDLREDLHSALAATLGQDRFQRFMDVTEEGLDAGFSRFGDGLHSLSFQWVFPQEGDRPQLVIRDGWLFENNQNRMQIITTESTFEEWPEEYGDWLQWMPEGFTMGSG